MAKRGRPKNENRWSLREQAAKFDLTPGEMQDAVDDVRAVVTLLKVNAQPYPKQDDRVKEFGKEIRKSPRSIYSRLEHYEDNAKGWSRRFLDPIELPDGKLLTLREADQYLHEQHWTMRRRKIWKDAAQALQRVIAGGGSTMPAQIAVKAVVEWLNSEK
jgi:hypothetical protein